MSASALEEVSVLSSIYCGHGEFQILQQSADDGLLVQINSNAAGDQGAVVTLLFHIPPTYPSCPPNISVSSPALSRTQCQNIRKQLLEQAAAFPPEPMIHQLVQGFQHQYEQMMGSDRGANQSQEEGGEVDQWMTVLLLDHIRSRNRYVGLLTRWCHQLQLTGRLFVGQSILVVLLGARADIKGFCQCLKSVKVDVDSSGKKCKERMMKVLIEAPLASPTPHCPQGFSVRDYKSFPELTAAFLELELTAPMVEELLTSIKVR